MMVEMIYMSMDQLVLVAVMAVVVAQVVVVVAVGGAGGVGLIRIPTSFICSHAPGTHTAWAASYTTAETRHTGPVFFFS